MQYAYVLPKFASPERALIWDWWSQTHAKLPTPNAYVFSLAEGLRPDSADFTGYNKYGNLATGDGGLKFDKDGRFAYLNAYMQWGDEEMPCLGLYNSRNPAPADGRSRPAAQPLAAPRHSIRIRTPRCNSTRRRPA